MIHWIKEVLSLAKKADWLNNMLLQTTHHMNSHSDPDADPDPATVPVHGYTHKELAALYCISWNTLQRWLEPYEPFIGEKVGHIYNAKQVKMIFRYLGRPEKRR